MRVLPIVERELRVASRRRGTFWSRVASGLLAMLLFGYVFLEASWWRPPQHLGLQLFWSLAVVFVCFSLLLGVIYTADALGEERREGTMGLLFLTDLRGYDVVLGKLVGTSLGAVYGLMAMLPVLAIPVLLGGVEVQDFLRLVLVILNTVFFSLAAGLFMSSWVRSAVLSMGLTGLLVLGLNLAGPVLAVGYSAVHDWRPKPPEAWFVPSVGYACFRVAGVQYAGRPDYFWISVAITHGLAWLFLCLAAWRTSSGWRESGEAASRFRWLPAVLGAQWERLGREERGALLDANPCLWLTVRHRSKERLAWGLLLVVGGVWSVLAARYGWAFLFDGVGWLVAAVLLHNVFRWWLAGEAVQMLGPDRRNGALELLLTTPLSVGDVVRGRLEGLRVLFLWPILTLALVDLAQMSMAARYGPGKDAVWWIWTMVAMLGVWAADLWAIAHVGLWLGLRRRQTRWALTQTGGLIMILPMGLFFLVLNVVDHFGNNPMKGILFLYLVCNLGVALPLGLWAHRRLWTRLRQEASGERTGALLRGQASGSVPRAAGEGMGR